jgi:hypothetical protein
LYVNKSIFIKCNKGGFSFFLKEGWQNFYWDASGTTERASAGVRRSEGGVERNFGGVEHFIRGVREFLGGFNYPPKALPPVNSPMRYRHLSDRLCYIGHNQMLEILATSSQT